jgi:hypothetical protein
MIASSAPICLSRLTFFFPVAFADPCPPPFRPPFAANVARELNVAVYDILTLGRFIYSGALTSKDDYEFRLPSPPRGL